MGIKFDVKKMEEETMFVIEKYHEMPVEDSLIVSGFYSVIGVVHDEASARAIVYKAGYVPSKIGQDGLMPALRYTDATLMSKEEPIPKIDEFGFTNRILNILATLRIKSTEQLLIHTVNELLKSPHLGRKSAIEIQEKLAAKGYRLRGA